MYFTDNIKDFCRTFLRYIGNGYTKMQISYIPEKKRYKANIISNKLKNKYETDLSSGKRQYRKKKGKCNYIGIQYQDKFFVILKTNGEDDSRNKEKWINVYRKPIKLGNFLEIELIKDERGLNTFKLRKEVLKNIKTNIFLAIEKRNGTSFHKEIRKIYNLHRVLKYRGFYMQLSHILKEIKEEQKKHGTKFNLPRFFY